MVKISIFNPLSLVHTINKNRPAQSSTLPPSPPRPCTAMVAAAEHLRCQLTGTLPSSGPPTDSSGYVVRSSVYLFNWWW